jgi:hypothetical protein
MSHDITIPLDGKISLTSEPHPYRVPKPKPVSARTQNREAQAERRRELEAQGHIVKVGGTGATVFKTRYGQ